MPLLHWQRPALLLALPVVPLLALLWWIACGRARSALRALGGDARFGRVNALRGVLRIGALASLLLGLAAPALIGRGEVASRGVPLVFVLDVSDSMSAGDVAPDRLTRAREGVRRLCSLAPGATTGLVAAAGDAATVCPLTADRAAFLALLARAETNWFGRRGTRLLPALHRAGEMVRAEVENGVIVLVSDGEAHGEKLHGTLAALRGRGCVTHTLTVGTERGGLLPATPFRDEVTSRARPDRMARWARAGGGRAWRIDRAEVQLPRRSTELVPGQIAAAAARSAGAGVVLAPFLYAGAALLLVAERLLPAQSS
ncbi:MAG: VWA domain-containing protein [Candidatus Brocadiaceae bacterium]|jgi:Ca-activated chloride channel family protein